MVTGVVPSSPGSCLPFLSRIGSSNPTARRFFIQCKYIIPGTVYQVHDVAGRNICRTAGLPLHSPAVDSTPFDLRYAPFTTRGQGPHAGRRYRRAVPGAAALHQGCVFHVVLRHAARPLRSGGAVSGAGCLHAGELVCSLV